MMKEENEIVKLQYKADSQFTFTKTGEEILWDNIKWTSVAVATLH